MNRVQGRDVVLAHVTRARIMAWAREKNSMPTLVPKENRTRALCPGTKCEPVSLPPHKKISLHYMSLGINVSEDRYLQFQDLTIL